MKSGEKVQLKLDALQAHAFGKDPKLDEQTLRDALADSQARVVAKAAELVGERLCYGLISNLKSAFNRFLADPIKKDPQCLAKQSIARALVALDCSDSDFWFVGMAYRQMEPGWGPPTDAAVDIRASSAMGLVNSGYRRALIEIAALLNDPEPRARIGAARAIACGNPSEAELLLRFKVSIGDQEGEVLGECAAALLKVAGAAGVAPVAKWLASDDEVAREYAAIALGESQLPEALASLKSAWQDVLLPHEKKQLLTRAAALHRSDAAFDWLVSLIDEGSVAAAEAAIEALSIYKSNPKLSERVRGVLANRRTKQLDEVFAKFWS